MAVSSRGSRRGRSSGGAWKNSPILGVVLAVLIILALVSVARTLFGGSSGNEFILHNFPYQWISLDSADELQKGMDSEDGFTATIIRYDNNNVPSDLPFERDGHWWWRAYQCNSDKCPWLAKNRGPYIFPGVASSVMAGRLAWAQEGYPRGISNPETGEMPPEEEAKEKRYSELNEVSVECFQCAKAKLDAYNVGEYNDAEGTKMIEDLQARVLKKR